MSDKTTLGSANWIGHAGPDRSATLQFYKDVIGWKIADIALPNGPTVPCIMLENGPIGSFSPMPEETGSWTVYITVADVDACVKKASANGASVLSQPMDMPGVGRMATLMDPQGARFAVITYENN